MPVEIAKRTKARHGPLALLPWLLGTFGILLMGALARLAYWHRIVIDGEVLPMGGDEAYHLWRIARFVGGDDAAFDPMTNWPNGAICLWSPGFDQLAAWWVELLGAGGDPASIAQAACLFPVVVGLVGILASMRVTRILAGPGSGIAVLAAGLVAALIPRTIALGQVGRVDHHVTELLFVLLLMAWTLVPGRVRGVAALRSSSFHEVAGGILLAGGVWTMSVGLIYAGLAAFVLLALSVRRPAPESSLLAAVVGGGGPAFLGAAVILAGLYAPLVAEHGHAVSYVFPSYFQPVLFGVAGIALLAACSIEWRIRRGSSSPSLIRVVAARVGGGLGAAAAGLVLLRLISPETTGALIDGLTQYLATRDPWLATIIEIRPLLSLEMHPWNAPDRTWGAFGYLLPVVAILGLWQAWRVAPERAVRFAAWAALLLVLALMQSRWSRAAVAIVAPMTGLALMMGGTMLERALAKQSVTPRGRRVAAGAFILGASCIGVFSVNLTPLLAVRAPRPARGLHLAALHLRERARPAVPGNRSGILARWDVAQTVLYITGRPILSGGFGPFTGEDGFRAEQQAWGGSPESLWQMLEARDLGYVIAGASSFDGRVPGPNGRGPFISGPDGRGALDPSYFRAVPLSPMILGGSALPELDVRHLEHLMPTFASSELLARLGFPVPDLWVFEHVRGAELTGTTAPSSRIVVTVALEHPGGVVPYKAFTDSDGQGKYRMRFPLPTGVSSEHLSTSPRATVQVGERAQKSIEIPEGVVRDGGRIVIGD